MNAAVLSAAVADYRPAVVANEKIKKSNEGLVIELEKTPDIAATLGKLKQSGQIIAGFALETHDELKNAEDKLARKNFDLIILNSLRDAGAGFDVDTNKITVLHRDGRRVDFELKPKKEVAQDIVNEISTHLKRS
jgi:phosphopantothenoylcysteine decarboxylase/phosphopantothenate--cysteine ligase